MRKDDAPLRGQSLTAVLLVELHSEVDAAVTVPAGASNGASDDAGVVQSTQDIVGCPAFRPCTRCCQD